MTERLLDAAAIADRLGAPKSWVLESARRERSRAFGLAATCASTWPRGLPCRCQGEKSEALKRSPG
jgi:hypothetical protein